MHLTKFVTLGASVFVLATTDASAQVWTHEISDGTLWVRIDENRGGAITDLHVLVGGVRRRNIVDNGDETGRQIQASVYGNEWWDGNCWPCNNSCYWGWNPVQAGNACQQHSGGIVVEHGATRIVTETIPLQWNNLLGRSNIALRQVLEIIDPWVLRIEYAITNNETFGWSSVRLHELPVAYLQTSFNQAIAYQGPNPFTHDEVTVLPIPSNNISTTEPWIGWRDDFGITIALCRPGKYSDWTASTVGNANLMQAWTDLFLNPGQQGSIETYLVAGSNLTDVRNRIYALGP